MNATDLQKLRREVELAQKHGTTPDISAWDLFEILSMAERAVSSAGSMPISEHPEVIELRRHDHEVATRITHALMAERDEARAKITAAHAEGRRSAMEELAKEKERADRLDNALKEWLDKTQWVQDAVQSNKFSVMYLGHHRADVIRQEFDKLAQPLQQEGGKDLPAGDWPKDFRDVIKGAEDAAYKLGRAAGLEEAAKVCENQCDPTRSATTSAYAFWHAAAIRYLISQPSDKLQQASTTQAWPARGEGWGFAMVHKTGPDRGFSWRSDDPNFSSEWTRVPLVPATTYANKGGEPDWSAYAELEAKEAASAADAPTDQEIDDAVFALNAQRYAYIDDPASYRAVVRKFAATPAQATPEGADLPDHPGDGAYPWWSKQEAEAIQKWGAQQRRNGYAEGYDEKLSLLDRLTEQLREARAQLGIMSSKDDLLSRALKAEAGLGNSKSFFNPSFCNFTPPRDGTYLVSVKGGNCQIDYHAQERALAASQPAGPDWRMIAEGHALNAAALQEELDALKAAEPVARIDAGDDGFFAEILPDRSVKVGELLYSAAPPQQAD